MKKPATEPMTAPAILESDNSVWNQRKKYRREREKERKREKEREINK